MQRNILEYLEKTLPRFAEKTAFSDGETNLSFREVSRQSRAIGSYLCRQGLYQKPVVVFMKKHPTTIAAFLGAIYGGCYYVPLDAEMPRQRIERILSQLEEGLLITDEHTEKIASELPFRGKAVGYGEICAEPVNDAVLARVRERQLDIDPVYIVFTSGSTGVPKGVMGCHRSVIDYIENLCEVLEFDENTVFGNQTPLYFDACLKEILPTLKYGASTVLIPRQLFLFPVPLVEFLNRHRINTLCWVVSALTFVSGSGALEKAIPETVHTIAFASEVFPIRQLKLWQNALPKARFINLYGPTETTGICCYYEVDRAFSEEETLPIGRPFPNTQILLLDENDREPEPGCQGEICIRGSRLTLGYYRDRQRTEEVFTQNPLNPLYPEKIYRTGDLGRRNSRGELEFLGRKDSQIKHMGHRIELGEIEAAANSCHAVSGCCCVYDGTRITLFYYGSADPGSLAAQLRKKLPRYMLPQILRQLERLPLTPNGKIDRNTLKQRSDTYE